MVLLPNLLENTQSNKSTVSGLKGWNSEVP
jgi:hypothetical protein